MTAKFASTGDLAEKKQTFAKLGEGVYCLTAEGDPNSGVIVGDDGVMVIDARATPAMARQLVDLIRTVTDKPIKYVVLTHYHAVRVLGASGYGAEHIIASEATRELIVERGRHDMKSEIGRFPRLFRAVETIPGLTWPTITFKTAMTIWMGKREVRLLHLGAGHTRGDAVVWLPREKILFSGDLVEEGATPYCGDAYLAEWPHTLERLKKLGARKLVPGRGEAMMTARASRRAIEATQGFVRTMTAAIKAGVRRRQSLKQVYDSTVAKLKPRYGNWVIFEHCLPFNVTRGYDEAKGIRDPRIWTAKRDRAMWKSLQG
jgi:glyoxylase-like metal-dependent hydrolase (beta-lactamase superfamily II)